LQHDQTGKVNSILSTAKDRETAPFRQMDTQDGHILVTQQQTQITDEWGLKPDVQQCL